MGEIELGAVRDQLRERRELLQQVPGLAGRRDLQGLIQEIDAALGRIDGGAFGLCERCHDPIERDRLGSNPLVRVCLGCLSEHEARALERDLERAATIQARLLPAPTIHESGWSLHHRYRPLGPVSGDHCDVILPTAPGEPLHFMLGDVSGKGVAASLLMANLHAIFRSLLPSPRPLAEIVGQANRLFAGSTLANAYATMVVGRLGLDGSIELCNAGHVPPRRFGGACAAMVERTGLPLGAFADAEFETLCDRFEPGELLLLCTDGLSEARNAAGDLYGETGDAALPSALVGLSAESAVERWLADLDRFRGATPLSDDLTVMAIRRDPAG